MFLLLGLNAFADKAEEAQEKVYRVKIEYTITDLLNRVELPSACDDFDFYCDGFTWFLKIVDPIADKTIMPYPITEREFSRVVTINTIFFSEQSSQVVELYLVRDKKSLVSEEIYFLGSMVAGDESSDVHGLVFGVNSKANLYCYSSE